MEIFNDILNGINDETLGGDAKPTRIAHHANMSYDKLTRYLEELERKQMITNPPPNLTEKGRKFLQDYDRIHDFVIQMKLDYIEDGDGGSHA